MLKTKTRQHGETLVEILVTVLFLSIGIISLARFQTYLSYNNSVALQKSTASSLAMSAMEAARDFQVLTNTGGYTSYQSITTGSNTSAGTSTTYTVARTVTTNTNPTYKIIDITVSWSDRNGNTQSVRLTSNVAGIDPQNSAIIM